ncbi:MAG: nucleotidyltransferase domain-containing protein [bacterium]
MIASQEIVDKAVDFIKEKVSPEKVYLFGSYANGRPNSDSDLDFLIIKSTNLPKHQRTLPLYTLDKSRRINFPIGIDFIIYTPEEFEQKKSSPNSLAGEVARTGKVVYEK